MQALPIPHITTNQTYLLYYLISCLLIGSDYGTDNQEKLFIIIQVSDNNQDVMCGGAHVINTTKLGYNNPQTQACHVLACDRGMQTHYVNNYIVRKALRVYRTCASLITQVYLNLT